MTIFPTADTTVASLKPPLTKELVKLILRFFPAVPSSVPSIAPITVEADPVPLKTVLPTTDIAFSVVLADPTLCSERISVAAGDVIAKVALPPA